MKKFIKPVPIEKENILDPNKVIMSKTDYKGVIQYANDYFMQICKYEEYELMGKPHNVIRHPDMPKVIFKFMWERLHKGKNIYAVVKNIAKDGSYYWVMTSFETTYDDYGNILAHYARRKAVPNKAKATFEDMYQKLIKIEQHNALAAEKYFYGLIENSGMSYDELFLTIVDMNENEIVAYFQNKEMNTNTSNENAILDMDINQVNKHQNTDNQELKQSVEDLKKQIATLQSALTANNTQKEDSKNKKGFFGRLFS